MLIFQGVSHFDDDDKKFPTEELQTALGGFQKAAVLHRDEYCNMLRVTTSENLSKVLKFQNLILVCLVYFQVFSHHLRICLVRRLIDHTKELHLLSWFLACVRTAKPSHCPWTVVELPSSMWSVERISPQLGKMEKMRHQLMIWQIFGTPPMNLNEVPIL